MVDHDETMHLSIVTAMESRFPHAAAATATEYTFNSGQVAPCHTHHLSLQVVHRCAQCRGVEDCVFQTPGVKTGAGFISCRLMPSSGPIQVAVDRGFRLEENMSSLESSTVP